MATAQDLLDDLNDFLGDANNAAGIGEAKKLRSLNRGIAAMWPKVYRTVVDSSLASVVGQYEYSIPGAIGDHGIITSVEFQQDSGDRYRRLRDDEHEVSNAQTGKKLILEGAPSVAGHIFRITAARQITPLASAASTYDGPPGSEEIPAWYALGLVLSRNVEGRSDYTRYSTVNAQNGVGLGDIEQAATFAFAQFELLLERYSLPILGDG